MSLFDSIWAILRCPDDDTERRVEIQIKWRPCPWAEKYGLGSFIDELFEGFNNTWVRSSYACSGCSPPGKYVWHDVYIKIESQCIQAIMSECDFHKLDLHDYVDEAVFVRPTLGRSH